MNQQEKVWYTPAELAALIGLKASWVRDHITRKQPRIRAHKFGRLHRIHIDDVREFLDQVATIPKEQ
jgi:excisionase family DNA binding protein